MDKACLCCKLDIGACWIITLRVLMGMGHVLGSAWGCHIGSTLACWVVKGLHKVLGFGKPSLVCPLFWIAIFQWQNIEIVCAGFGWRFLPTTIYKRWACHQPQRMACIKNCNWQERCVFYRTLETMRMRLNGMLVFCCSVVCWVSKPI